MKNVTHIKFLTIPAGWVAGIILLLYAGLFTLCALLPGASLLDRLHWLDSGICAQIPTHMLLVGTTDLPLCSRNTGIYLGFILTLISLYTTKKGRAQKLPSRPILITLVGGVILLAIDGVNSLLLDLGMPHLYQPANLLRFATGLVTGLALAACALPLLNQQCWKRLNQQPSITTWKELCMLIPALLISFVAVAAQRVQILYPVAILSTAGLITALGILNLTVIIVLSKRDETFEQYWQMLPFIGLGFVLSIGELLLLAELKIIVLRLLGV